MQLALIDRVRERGHLLYGVLTLPSLRLCALSSTPLLALATATFVWAVRNVTARPLEVPGNASVVSFTFDRPAALAFTAFPVMALATTGLAGQHLIAAFIAIPRGCTFLGGLRFLFLWNRLPLTTLPSLA